VGIGLDVNVVAIPVARLAGVIDLRPDRGVDFLLPAAVSWLAMRVIPV
jgi:hypothetical protein